FVIGAFNSNLRGVAVLQGIEREDITQRRDQFLAEVNAPFLPELISAAHRNHMLVAFRNVLLIFGAGGDLAEARYLHAHFADQGIQAVGSNANAAGAGWRSRFFSMAVPNQRLDISREGAL